VRHTAADQVADGLGYAAMVIWDQYSSSGELRGYTVVV
jgi:hypothetical protein